MAELDRVLESIESVQFQGDITAIANKLGVQPDVDIRSLLEGIEDLLA